MITRKVVAAVAADLDRRTAREALLARVLANEIAALTPTSRMTARDLRGVTPPLARIKI